MSIVKRLTIIIGIIFTFIFTALLIYACQPCAEILNFEETVNKSDLIIVGQKVAEGPRSDFGEGYGGPDWIEVRIIKVLKGDIKGNKIIVNSWDPMCPYGIIVDDKPYAMLLEKRESSGENYKYDAVNFGCAIKTFLVENNMIDFEGKKISINDFIAKFNLKTSRQNEL